MWLKGLVGWFNEKLNKNEFYYTIKNIILLILILYKNMGVIEVWKNCQWIKTNGDE